MKSLFAALAALAVFTLSGCNKNTNVNQIFVSPLGPTEIAAIITGISVSPASITIERNRDDGCYASVVLTAAVNGTGEYSRAVVWSSSEGVVENGRFRVGKAGTYIVTVVAQNGMTATATIIVTNGACGGGGENPPPPDPGPDPGPGPGPNPPPPPPPTPPTVTLSFTGNPLSIKKGQSSILTWSSNASCAASGGWSGHKGTSGSQSVSPVVDTDYELNCGGVSGKVKITVTEDTPPPPPPPPAEKPVVNFSASPGSIQNGQNSILSWSTQHAVSCSASGAWGGSKGLSGSQSVSPTSSSSYTLSCTGPGGTTAKTVTITVTNPPPPPPPAKLTLSYTPAGGTIALGAMPTLTPICKMGTEVVSCPSDLWWSSTVPNTVAVVPEDRTYSSDPVWGSGFRKGGTIAARKVGQATICVEKKFDSEVAPFCAMFQVQ